MPIDPHLTESASVSVRVTSSVSLRVCPPSGLYTRSAGGAQRELLQLWYLWLSHVPLKVSPLVVYGYIDTSKPCRKLSSHRNW